MAEEMGRRHAKRDRARLRGKEVAPAASYQPKQLYEPGPALGQSAQYLIHFMKPGFDPGNAATMVIDQILSALPSQRVATFNTDELLDYRANRPVATFSNWVMEDLIHPEIALDLVTDLGGRKLLVLHGPEPDLRWSQFTLEVARLAGQSGVQMGIDLLSVAATIPHTRPTIVHYNATEGDILPDQGEDPGIISLPAPLNLALREQLANHQIPGMGLVVAVPYYLVEGEFPQAAVAAISHISKVTGLQLPVGDLEAAGSQVMKYLQSQMDESEEIRHVVSLLERAFDENAHRPSSLMNPMEGATEMPTADEIGKRVEEFLASFDIADESDAPAGSEKPSLKSWKITNPDKILPNPPYPRRRGRHLGDDFDDE